MAITKKIRFEVFKRDGFACAYCGRTPPIVTLEIDHIEPKAKGGKDHIDNLIVACFDCNRGKRDIPLETLPNKITENLDILKEREEQLREYRRLVSKIERRLKSDIDEVDSAFSESFPDRCLSDSFRNVSVKNFLQKLPKHIVIDAMRKAGVMAQNSDHATKYFCGICWNIIKGKGF